MTDWYWPADLIPQSQVFTMNTRAAVSRSPLTALTQTVARGGGYWSAELTWQAVVDSIAQQRLEAMLALIAEQSDRVYLPDFAAKQADSVLDTSSILINGNCLSTTGWSKSAGTFYLAGGWLLHRNSAGSYCYQTITTYAAGARYCLTFNLRTGGDTVDVNIGTTLNGTELASSADLDDGGHRLCFTAPASGAFYISWATDTGGSSGHTWLNNCVCAPALRVSTAGASGREAQLKDCQPHGQSVQILAAGEKIAIDTGADNLEIKRLQLGLYSALGSSPLNDQGIAIFDPALRASPAADADVLLGAQAGALMRLASPGYDVIDFPGRQQYRVQLVEAFGP